MLLSKCSSNGHIFIDGVDISFIDVNRLRDHISIVTQENQLFDETIYENIRVGKLDAGEEQIFDACRLAFVTEFSDKLSEKLQTKVGPRGVKLSGGERQRVNIARSLVRNAPIFLLDEPTASLDSKSEELVKQAFYKAMLDKTTLIISHRISTIAKASKIIVLDNGKVVDQGKHHELVKKAGLYSDLVSLQMLGEEKD